MAPPSTPAATYMTIPPPPLPEFYRDTEAQSGTSRSSDSRTDDSSQRGKLPAVPGDGADDRWYTKVNKTTAPREALDERVPPLAVYHICRICLRPRSARYHREHPIPIDGLPPPPGICRRCRISSVDTLKTVTDVIEQKESNDVKIGIKAFVPNEDCFTNEEMRAKRARRILSDATWIELEPASGHKTSSHKRSSSSTPTPKSPPPVREEIIYRHVHVTVPPPPQRSRSVVYGASTAQDATNAVGPEASNRVPVNYSTYWIPPPPPPQRGHRPVTQPVEVEASVSSHAPTSPRSKHRSPSHHASVSIRTTGRERSESEIRRLARDEVERYRRAERRIEGHRDPYAHGRIVEVERVPVERRILLETDTVEPAPWEANYNIPRKDSGIANFKDAAKRAEREKEVVVQRSSAADDRARFASANISQTGRLMHSPPSSTSSDKTRWPSEKQTGHVSERYRLDDSNKSSHRTYVVAERAPTEASRRSVAKESKYEVTELTGQARSRPGVQNIDIRYESDKNEPRLPDRVAELREDFERRERTEAWSQETQKAASNTHSSDSSGQRPACIDASYVSARKMEHSPRRGGEVSGKQVEIKKSRVGTTLPYPQDDSSTPVSMPSPSSHVSKPTRVPLRDEARPRNQDNGEYVYVERKVQALGRSPKSRRDYDEYEEVERYIHRTKPQIDQAAEKAPAAVRIREEDLKRRPSDASSRVRFSKKVEISPTPPGSDASSSQFRSFSQFKSQGPETESGADIIAEYERRGRQRSREPTAEFDYYREHHPRTDLETDRDRTPRPGPRQQRRSGSTETAEVPSNLGHLARCFSESPSRERLDEAARRQRMDNGLGPYAVHEKRSVSVDVEDGSSVSSDSWHQSSYHERSGRRGAR